MNEDATTSVATQGTEIKTAEEARTAHPGAGPGIEVTDSFYFRVSERAFLKNIGWLYGAPMAVFFWMLSRAPRSGPRRGLVAASVREIAAGVQKSRQVAVDGLRKLQEKGWLERLSVSDGFTNRTVWRIVKFKGWGSFARADRPVVPEGQAPSSAHAIPVIPGDHPVTRERHGQDHPRDQAAKPLPQSMHSSSAVAPLAAGADVSSTATAQPEARKPKNKSAAARFQEALAQYPPELRAKIERALPCCELAPKEHRMAFHAVVGHLERWLARPSYEIEAAFDAYFAPDERFGRSPAEGAVGFAWIVSRVANPALLPTRSAPKLAVLRDSPMPAISRRPCRCLQPIWTLDQVHLTMERYCARCEGYDPAERGAA